MHELETRLLALVGDVLTAVGRGELQPESPLVRAAAAALAELRRSTEKPIDIEAASLRSAVPAPDVAPAGRTRVAPPVEQVLAVARRMRQERASFAAACAAVAEDSGSSAQAVRNACTRWMGVAAADWQPLLIGGAGAGVAALARKVAERCPWLRDRIADEFGVEREALPSGGEPAGTLAR